MAASALEQNPITDFTNNDGWHDDWADGWVKATVTLAEGTSLECEPMDVLRPQLRPAILPLVTPTTRSGR